ncbi:MAG: LCP family protein [Actinocatenispora sp.]
MGVGRSTRTRRRSPWWAKLCLVLGIVLVVTSGGSIAAGSIVLVWVNAKLHQDNLLTDSSRTHDGEVTGPLDILLAGSDLRDSWIKAGKKPRADSIMWLHIPASHDRAYLLSLARDLVVDIPAYRHSGWSGGRDRLNSAFTHGMSGVNDTANGMRLLGQTISNLTGVRFDMAGLVNWDGFTAVTTALGGVTMCLDKGFTSTQKGFTDERVTFYQGCHHYKAKKALKLVRQREDVIGDDYGRQRLQQQFVKQILKQATSRGVVGNPGKLNKVLDAAGDSITLDLGGYQVAELAFALRGIRQDQIVTMQPPHDSIGSGRHYRGESVEQPAADRLFTALRTGHIDGLLLAHPELISKVP